MDKEDAVASIDKPVVHRATVNQRLQACVCYRTGIAIVLFRLGRRAITVLDIIIGLVGRGPCVALRLSAGYFVRGLQIIVSGRGVQFENSLQ